MNNVDAFAIKQVGTAGHEILDPNGNVVAWAVDEPWALMIADLAEREGIRGVLALGRSRRRCCRCRWRNSAWPVGEYVLESESVVRSSPAIDPHLSARRAECPERYRVRAPGTST